MTNCRVSVKVEELEHFVEKGRRVGKGGWLARTRTVNISGKSLRLKPPMFEQLGRSSTIRGM